MKNICSTQKVVYGADVSTPIAVEKMYFGLLETTFKERHRNLVLDFKHWKYETSTGLSEYIWKLKGKGFLPTVKWKLLSKVNSTPRRGYCKLCLTEKYWIINCLGDGNLLNQKSELISKYRQEEKVLIKSAERK